MKKLFILILTVICLASCGKWLDDIAPKHAVTSDKLTENDMNKLTNGVLYTMERFVENGWWDGDYMGEALANGPGFGEFSDVLVMTPSTGDVLSRWQKSMTSLFQVNELIEAAKGNSNSAAKNALKTGYFFRAYIYFNMYIRWGTAPIQRENTVAETPLSSGAAVIDFVIEDLLEALKYPASNNGFFYVSDDAINAMLAKAYLWKGDNGNAVLYAQKVINNNSFALATNSADLANTWTNGTSSKEIVFALANKDAKDYVKLYAKNNDTDSSWEYSMPGDLYSNLYTETDIRKSVVINPADAKRIIKFPNGMDGQFVENKGADNSPLVLIRIAEMHLLKAEAQGNTPDGIATLKAFVATRDADAVIADSMTDDQWKALISKEYLREFYSEGHRWFDIKRMGLTNELKTLNGRNYLMLWPIPQHEIDLLVNKSAYPQNTGYAQTSEN